ncbi:hypothetical protein SDC9_154616 [bioreactor metagenome]|uniref:Uncharacterized protein n=1 Tax=bioreactor metagenome TaxID=1076179 RepID=A0A645F0S6_9ZZZZ
MERPSKSIFDNKETPKITETDTSNGIVVDIVKSPDGSVLTRIQEDSSSTRYQIDGKELFI